MLTGIVAEGRLPVALLVVAAQDHRLAWVLMTVIGRGYRLLVYYAGMMFRKHHRMRAPLRQQDKQERRGQKCPHIPFLPDEP